MEQTTAHKTSSRFTVDLLQPRALRRLLLSPAFPFALQLVGLCALVALAANGWGIFPESTEHAKILRKTNLTTLLVWGLWWPLLIVGVLLLGRAWCTVCPLELVTNLCRRAAARVGFRGTGLPRWMRSGVLILLVYVLLQILVAVWDLHRNPVAMVFRDPRAFCKAFCPAGLQLDAYGRYAPFNIAPKDEETCAACATKDCIDPDLRSRFDRRSCPHCIRPDARAADDGCVLCLQCAKVCPHANVGLGWLKPDKGPRAQRPLGWATAVFVLLAGGFVMHELFSEVKSFNEVFHWIPQRITDATGIPFGWTEALWFLAIIPAVLLGVTALAGVFSGGWRPRAGLTRVALLLVPVIACGHAAKAIIKMCSWGPYLSISARAPDGIERAAYFLANPAAAPGSILPAAAKTVVGLALVVLGGLMTARLLGREAHRADRPPAVIAATALVLVYGFVAVGLTLAP